MSVTESQTQSLAQTEDVSTAVIMAISEATGTPATELPPMYDAIDPDALDAIFQGPVDARPRTGIAVTFTMAGCTVDICDGAVTVIPDVGAETDESPAPA